MDRKQAMQTVCTGIQDKIGWDPEHPVADVKQWISPMSATSPPSRDNKVGLPAIAERG